MKAISIIVSIIIILYYGLLFLGALFFAIHKELKNNKDGKENSKNSSGQG